MPIVKMLKPVVSPDWRLKKDDRVNLPKEIADAWLEAGHAEKTDAKKADFDFSEGFPVSEQTRNELARQAGRPPVREAPAPDEAPAASEATATEEAPAADEVPAAEEEAAPAKK